MAFAKFEENRFRIDGEIAENHAILVNLTASIIIKWFIIFISIEVYRHLKLWISLAIQASNSLKIPVQQQIM